MDLSRLTRDGTAGPVSRDQILRHARGRGNINFPCAADHEQDWQPYPVDPYSAICDGHTYIHTYILVQQYCRLYWFIYQVYIFIWGHAHSYTVHYCLKKSQNAPRPSEHPPVRGKNVNFVACVCFLPIHSGHQVRWTYQPGSHRRTVTQDFSSTFFLRCGPLFFSREGFSDSFPSSTVKSNFVY